jgi:hypothetical protein
MLTNKPFRMRILAFVPVDHTIAELFEQDCGQTEQRRAQQYHKDQLQREHFDFPVHLSAIADPYCHCITERQKYIEAMLFFI